MTRLFRAGLKSKFFKKLGFNGKVLSLTSLILIMAASVFAAPIKVDYYGVVSQSSDANMLKMAQDIFYSQLKSIDNITVNDKRPDISKALTQIPMIKSVSKNLIAFYAEIDEGRSEETGLTVWKCKFNAVSTADGITHTKNETYDSYYKILSSAKNDIEDILKNLYANEDEVESAPQASVHPSGRDIESLAGTWSGEPYTDKIIILRGGKGFVIFKNGATMNIHVSVKSSKDNSMDVEIKQIGKSNASYFPELPRETALQSASKAKPIIWSFKLVSPDRLEGTKTTMIPSSSNDSGVEQGVRNSVWTKK